MSGGPWVSTSISISRDLHYLHGCTSTYKYIISNSTGKTNIIPSIPATAAHIAFTAPSRTAVRDFYAAALNAGARPNGAPACRTEDSDHFNAAVLDFDGNSIEVVYRGGEPDVRDDGTVVQHSRVIEWRRSVTGSVRDGDGGSVVSARTSASKNAPSIASAAETLSKAATLVRSVSAPVAPTIATTPGAAAPHVEVTTTTTTKVTASGDGAAKKIIGTLLGAAAGAAVAYAMVKSEEDSARKEAKFIRYMEAKEAAALQQQQQQAPLAIQDAQPVYSSASRSVVSGTSAYGPRAIEAAPPSYHSPSYATVPPTQINAAGGERLAIEYAPAYSVAGSQTHSQFAPPRRSVTSPELSTVSMSKARSTVSRAPSAVQSVAASTLISSFVPEHVERRGSEGSVYSSSSRAHKAKSHVSTHSKHSSSKSKPASIVGSILGRPSPSTTSSHKDPFADAYEIVDIDDLDDVDVDDASVAPSDSISNVSSHRSRRSHRSSHSHHSSKSHKSRKEKDGGDTVVSKHSSSSKHSKHSKHTSASKKSEKSHRSSPLREEWHDAESGAGKRSVVSEPSDASTVKPAKSTHSSHSRSSKRKDSVTSGNGYETLPIRGITPSMIAGDDGKAAATSKSMMSYAMGQRLRAFEGAS